jgi:hypothetical protein
MDILAHFLWTFAIYWQHPKRWIAGIIGFMPDIIAFGIAILARLVSGLSVIGKPSDVSAIPSYVFSLYGVTHSLVICALGMTLLWFFAREWFWISFGWPLHIIIDIPTHTGAFFPTPIFWPLSDFYVSGISWGVPWFMAANYSALLIIYTYLIWKVPRRLAA